MDASRVLLFAITRETRSLSSMALAAHYIGLGCNVVLCIQHLKENASINGEKVRPVRRSAGCADEIMHAFIFPFGQLTPSAMKDYNRGRNYLSDLANREGVPVFDEVHEAVECAVQRCQQMLQQSQTQTQQQR